VGSTLAGEDHLEDIEVADLAGLATFHVCVSTVVDVDRCLLAGRVEPVDGDVLRLVEFVAVLHIVLVEELSGLRTRTRHVKLVGSLTTFRGKTKRGEGTLGRRLMSSVPLE
jgi:hypothetical protein